MKLSALLVTLLCVPACMGTFDAANTPPQISASTTRTHCIALDVESTWLPGVSVGMGAMGTGLSTLAVSEEHPSTALKITALGFSAGALIVGAVGMSASKSWHEQCNVVAIKSQSTTQPAPVVSATTTSQAQPVPSNVAPVPSTTVAPVPSVHTITIQTPPSSTSSTQQWN